VRGIVGISGTPGTGKKTVAPKVAKLLGLSAVVSINSLAPKGATEVDPKQIRSALMKSKPQRVALFGHLLPHVLYKREAAFVAVLRCDPSALKARLTERGYSSEKVTENVEAELIGVVLFECVERYGAALVREYDTTSAGPEAVAKAISMDAKAALAGTKKPARVMPPWIDWTLDYDSSSKLRSLLAG
jgi:adenylate kinase